MSRFDTNKHETNSNHEKDKNKSRYLVRYINEQDKISKNETIIQNKIKRGATFKNIS